MTRAYRSTALRLVDDACPAALDFSEANTPFDRDVFQVGIAAHAVLQVVGETLRAGKTVDAAVVGNSVVRELVTVGRAFEGEPEPPMSVAAATAGRDLALDYLTSNELSATAEYERGLAVDANWKPVGYDSPEVYYRAALDVLDIVEAGDDDGYQTTTVIVSDWKSSWRTSADELDTVQLRGQAAIAVAHHPEATIVRRRAVNLRTGRAFEADLVLDDAGMQTIARWRADIDHAIAAAEARGADGKRPYRPGAGCFGCWYLTRCEGARQHLRGSLLDGLSAEGIAVRLAALEAMRAELIVRAKALADEGPIPLPDGGFVGFTVKVQQKTTETAPIAHDWFHVEDPETWDGQHGEILGLLATLLPGVTSIKRVAKTLYPSRRGEAGWKESREALLAASVTPKAIAQFGVHKATNPNSLDTDPDTEDSE